LPRASALGRRKRISGVCCQSVAAWPSFPRAAALGRRKRISGVCCQSAAAWPSFPRAEALGNCAKTDPNTSCFPRAETLGNCAEDSIVCHMSHCKTVIAHRRVCHTQKHGSAIILCLPQRIGIHSSLSPSSAPFGVSSGMYAVRMGCTPLRLVGLRITSTSSLEFLLQSA